MDAKHTVEQKLLVAEQLPLLEAYSKIQEYSGPDQLDLLQQALQRNLKGLFKTGYLNVSNFDDLCDLVQICSQPELLGLYFKYAKLHLQNHHQSLSKMATLLEVLGAHLDRLTQEFRKEGSLQEKLHLRADSSFQYQKIIIELVMGLQPKHFAINPELFEYLLVPFLVSQKHFHLTVLMQLAEGIKSFMEKQEDNSDYYWLLVFQFVFEAAKNGNFKSLLILVQKFYPELVDSILYSNHKFFLLKYFDSLDQTLSIFKGLFQYYISDFAILITTQFTKIFLLQMEKYDSKLYAEILQQMYYQVILPKILPNLQMFDSHKEILTLLQLYLNGMQELKPEYVDRLIYSIRLLLKLKFSSRDFTSTVNTLLKDLINNVPGLHDHKDLKELYAKTKKSHGYFYDVSDSAIKLPSKWDFKNARNDKFTGFQLLEKKSNQYVGLENLTNTCYMNSFLQSLFMNSEFRNFILTIKQTNKPLVKELRDLFLLLIFQKQGFVSPHKLKRSLSQPYATSTDQQDVNEFIHHFLEGLQEELSKEGQSYLQKLFFGTSRSVFTCGHCKEKQYGVEEQLFGLDLFFSHKSKESSILNDIPNMIKEVGQVEEIEYECPQCKKKSASSKQNEVISLPEFLMITLQRFTYDAELQQKIKLLQRVKMEFRLDFSELLPVGKGVEGRSCEYELYAFIVHLVRGGSCYLGQGQKSDSGHYITYARETEQNPSRWISFDDTFIMEQEVPHSRVFDEQLIEQETPYILFYKNVARRDCQLVG